MKLYVAENDPRGAYTFYCPGCGFHHAFYTKAIRSRDWNGHEIETPTWNFNGNLNFPTFGPSLITRFGLPGGKTHICHLYLRDGKIEYQPDCTHELAGKTLNLPETWLRR